MLVSFICYAFNLTLSTWVGGIGMRYRLYSRLGLSGATITRIFSLSITTNWLGYILLGGIIFSSGMVKVPERWYISQSSLQILGVVLLLISAFYLWACAFAKKRHLTIKASGWCFRLALRDIADGGFQPELDGDGGDYLAAAGPAGGLFSRARRAAGQQHCGVIVHIPAGIGVLEAVFIAMLSGKRFRAARLLPPCLPIAPCTTSCRCCWRPSAT